MEVYFEFNFARKGRGKNPLLNIDKIKTVRRKGIYTAFQILML